MNLQSDKISLQVDFDHNGFHEEELWHLLRRTAVEPGQASSPDLASFANECLLCAQIFIEKEDPVTVDTLTTPSLSRASTVSAAHTRDSGLDPQSTVFTPPLSPEDRKAGFIYLHASPANLPAGEVNIGVIIKRGVQGRGYAREAVQLVLRWVFEELKFHRVQAAVLDTPLKDKALRLFIGSGFAHEGTKRRSVYQPEGEGVAGVWKDVTYLAMLDTEWMLRSSLAERNGFPEGPVVSFWDEMFTRHSREREELLRWEEKHGRIRMSSSTETLRESGKCAGQEPAYYLTDDAASSVGEPSLSGSSPPSPRLNVFVTWEEDTHMADNVNAREADQGWEHVVESSFASRRHRCSFLDLSPARGPTLALPSIPSTRLSEGNLQSPITIPSPSSGPPFSPSPSPGPSSPHSSWSDSEHEDKWQLHEGGGHPASSNPPDSQFTTTPQQTNAGPASSGWMSRRSSVSSSSSSDSWSDAHSSVWDMMSDTSDQ